MKRITIKIRKKEGCSDLPLPAYATSGSSGMDLYADVESEVLLEPLEIKLISAGIYISIPEGYEAQIRPRSGLALKHGITMVNTPGTIDSDYRGLISLIVINLGKAAYRIRRGDRIAQMVIKEVVRADLDEAGTDGRPAALDETARSTGGFGHTGR
ncbi:MAG: dUTP diphosphatase [Candidatus Omnitrophica bacterium]|nr:dUTP diphosphatase [Candidatus Omnitrophota bacterium]